MSQRLGKRLLATSSPTQHKKKQVTKTKNFQCDPGPHNGRAPYPQRGTGAGRF